VIAALESRGHAVSIAYCTDSGTAGAGGVSRRLQRFNVASDRAGTLAAIQRWSPDVCYSHNMHDLAVDRDLERIAPVVKFMHGYFGTCVSGLKMHAVPNSVACDRAFGFACLALYLPRHCGQRSPAVLMEQWRWAKDQQSLFDGYSAIVVASEHMRREYVRNGCQSARVHVNPLFPTNAVDAVPSALPAEPHVMFLGRMTTLKGGDLLIRAVREAVGVLGRPIRLTMIGDGPQRADWEALARQLEVSCAFTGWIGGDDRWSIIRGASLVALPSVWPEPFGLVGLEAGALGVPAIAVDTGGITQWLQPGVNGVVVPNPASARSFGTALAGLLQDRARLASLRAGAHRIARDMTIAAHVDRLEIVLRDARAGRTSIPSH
jgi:glycosyltransferase involved in cell wall biosynthesis